MEGYPDSVANAITSEAPSPALARLGGTRVFAFRRAPSPAAANEPVSELGPYASGATSWTQTGAVNQHGQRCEGQRSGAGVSEAPHPYRMSCTKPRCGSVYGASPVEVLRRRCPRCQGGAPGKDF